MRRAPEEEICLTFSEERKMADKTKKKDFNGQKLMLVILAVFLSVIFWVYVTNQEGQEDSFTYPGVKVVLEGEANMRDSRGLIITDIDTTSMRVTVTGSPRALAKLTAADITAVIDLSTITKTGNYSYAPKITYSSDFSSSDLTAKVTGQSTVNFYVDKLSTRTIEVKGINNGSTAEGFSAEPLEFSPATVKISGPETSLAKVDHAWIEVLRENVDSTLSYESSFVLRDKDNKVIEDDAIILETDTVNVTLPVIAIKEVDLVIATIPGGGAGDENLIKTFDPVSKITLSGDAEVLEGVNSILLDTVDLSKIDGTYSETYTIVIPNDTEIIGSTREVTVKFEIVGLDTKRVNIPSENLSFINVTEGYTAEIMDTALNNVTLRGLAQNLEAVSAENVRAVADLTDYGTATGIFTVPVKIYVDGSTSVGAIGEYKLYISIAKAE